MKKRIIIIVPCYNEAASLPHLIKALKPIREKVSQYDIDLMLINDGSSDGTQALIDDLIKKHDYIYFREFIKNSGHQSALRSGLNVATGYDAAITMDADMQHPPEMIPDLIAEWQKGSNIVQMVRKDNAKSAGTFKYLTSRLYYKFINMISDLNLEYGASDFRLIDKSVIQTVAESPEKDLFLRGYFSWLKVSRATLEYTPNARIAGESKYTFKKMLDLAYKGILQFSEKPLRVAMMAGILLALASLVYGIVLIILYFAGSYAVSGWTSLMVVTVFCFGISFILLGIIGTYLAHLIQLEKKRPDYIVGSQKLPKMLS